MRYVWEHMVASRLMNLTSARPVGARKALMSRSSLTDLPDSSCYSAEPS